MREISGLAKFGYFCVGLFGGLFGVLAAWFMGKDGWGWSEGGKLGDHGGDRRHRDVPRLPVLASRQSGALDRVTLRRNERDRRAALWGRRGACGGKETRR